MAVVLATSAGDAVRVNPNPSGNLQFDSTKCSHGGSSRSDQEKGIAEHGSSSQQFLSHLVHVLVSIAKVPSYGDLIAADPEWMNFLFSGVGLGVKVDESGTSVAVTGNEAAKTCLPSRWSGRRMLLWHTEGLLMP